ncbi:uncharacterized protein DUF4123 [Litoreibacter ponti]|uniref:Uncharacterized protein DUF4123 n=1 Tax=Litoreibacter ponti TaxID=1510457 RepID=A0A2T6BHC5_9RHOB|nr:DUF4123 domain-containing protein [Litoreibacter ponti]PTX55459.1 uncharacterized protein DUF4123 [Litoreibacter ponti]
MLQTAPSEISAWPFSQIEPNAPFAKLDSRVSVAPNLWEDRLFGSAPEPVYAVLDGALLPGLSDALALHGERARCLFNNSAARDFEETAPWLFQLQQDCKFSQSLFVRDPDKNVPWHRWGRDGYVLVQCDFGLDALRHHLRKHTRIQDASRKWYLYRFWDPRLMTYVVADFQHTQWTPSVWKIPRGGKIHWFDRDVLRTMSVSKSEPANNVDHQVFDALARYGFWIEAGRVWDESGRGLEGRQEFQLLVIRFCETAGFQGALAIEHAAIALLLCPPEVLIERYRERLPVRDPLRAQSVATSMSKYALRKGSK